MTSQINPQNINKDYPVVGVANNTQGFRDNFKFIQENFTAAKSEIDDLQSKALVKSALSGTTIDNNMNDNVISAVQLRDVSWTLVPVGATSGAITIDYSAGQYQMITPTAPVSISITNWPSAGTVGSIRLGFQITNVAHTVTLPAAVSIGLGGIEGISPGIAGQSNTITFGRPGAYAFEFATSNGGQSVWLFDQSRPQNRFFGNVEIQSETDSVSPGTGALQVDGGVGIVGNLNVGGLFVTYNSNNNPVFSASTSGFVTINAPSVPGNSIGALNIVGTESGNYQPIYNPGSMLHITGNDGQASRITVDSFGTGAPITYVNRFARGNVDVPAVAQNGDVLCRFVASGWIGNTYSVNVANVAPTSVEFVATENYNSTSAGSRIDFYTSPNGAIAKTLSATMTGTGVTVPGTIVSGNTTVTGAGGVRLTGNGTMGYGPGAGGIGSQPSNKTSAVTINKPSGQITMANNNIGAGEVVSFALTNSTITNTDVLVINHVSGGTIGAYTVNAACNAGSATIYVRNNTSVTLGEALVLRFAVIKGSTT